MAARNAAAHLPHLWCLVLVLQLGPGAHGAHAQQSTSIAGWLRVSYFSSSRDLDEVHGVAGASAELKVKHALADTQRLELQARLLTEDFARNAHTQVQWSSAYWLMRSAHLDVRIGQQKIRWGKADGINPTDFFTPIDYTVTLPLEDDRYLSVPALRTDWHLSETDSLSLVISPHFTPTRVPWPKPTPVAIIEEEPSGLNHPQHGLRWTHTAEQLDWSVSAFRGYSTLPLLHFAGNTVQGSPTYLRHYMAIDGIGADLARSFGTVGFRAELAYTQPRDGDGRQRAQSSYFLVAGADRTFDEWSINVQALLRHTPHFERTAAFSDAARALAAQQNAIIHGQQNKTMYGMTARIVADWLHDTLQTELLLVSHFSPSNALVRPLLTYSVTDQRKLRLGAEYYTGPDLSYFGSLKRNRTVFLELQQFY